METILVLGDPHFRLTNRLQMEVVVDECVRVAQERKPTFIVCLGDILDRFSTIREEPLNQALDFFHRLLEHAPLVVLIGNHDRASNAVFCTDAHAFNACKYWDKEITIVDTPMTFDGYTFVPYVPNGRFREALALPDAAGWEQSKLIFAHQDFLGAEYNGLKSETGDPWTDALPLVVSGHIHDYQELKGVIYPGSPIQHASNESRTKTLFWIELYGTNKPVCTRIPISVPVYHTEVVAAADVATAALPALPPRSVCKVVVQGTYTELQGMGKWPAVRAWRQQGIVVQSKVLVSKAAARVQGDVLPSFRTLMASEVKGTLLEPLWKQILERA